MIGSDGPVDGLAQGSPSSHDEPDAGDACKRSEEVARNSERVPRFVERIHQDGSALLRLAEAERVKQPLYILGCRVAKQRSGDCLERVLKRHGAQVHHRIEHAVWRSLRSRHFR